MLKKLLFILAGLVLLGVIVFFAVGSALSGDYAVTRSIDITAGPEEIYALVGHLDRWAEWSTWNNDLHPDLVTSYPKGREGTGAILEWSMNRGHGQLEITSSEASRGISYELVVEDGSFRSDGIISFEASADPQSIAVTWRQEGPLETTAARWFGLYLASAMAADMEAGLTKLKETVEGEK